VISVLEESSSPISRYFPRQIMQLFTSGTLISYINKFKSVVREVGRQPDTPTKLITFVLGVCDMFKDD